jgi:hypothetical protein
MNAGPWLYLALTFFLVLSGCAKNKSASTLEPELKQTTTYVSLLANTVSPKVTTDVTIRKANLLGRTFLYGATLQTSSQINDEGERVPFVGLNLGLVTAEFVIVDNRLRLQADSGAYFESDVNRPLRLIQEFPIISQDDEFITFRADAASPAVDTFLFGDANKVAKRSAWIRSLEFSEADDLFLIQSSVELVDGSLAELMETLTPRERLVPVDAKPFYDEEDLNPLVGRYQFLSNDPVYVNDTAKGRVKAKITERAFLKDGQALAWYVTRNIPEKLIPDVKNGIEAWNRYTRAAGRPDIVRFAGLLPENVAIGDPRYNVVVWDNIAEADSAYESQNSDPLTGIQSNSIVYLPAAWVNIGKEYWESMAETEDGLAKRQAAFESAVKRKSFLGRRVPLHCLQGAHNQLSAHALESPEEFGRTLLKATLFHEVGHALGFAHNFKGSNSFDADAEKPLHSNSIMDYNLFNEDSAAFTSLDSSDGPLFEYDRQILSVLYNEGKDVRDSDPVLASCSDAEADSTNGGVDPLCQRYDLGNDPTKLALRSLDLLERADARLGRMGSLPKALARVTARLPGAETVPGQKEAQAALRAFALHVRGLVFSYIGGGNSIAAYGISSLKALYVFRDDVLPEGVSETDMRERSVSFLEKAAATNAYPAATAEALAKVRATTAGWLLSTPALSALPEKERAPQAEEWMKAYDAVLKGFDETAYSRMRTALAKNLKYSATAPLSFHARGGSSVDLEKLVISLLESAASRSIGDKARPVTERLEAIKTLATYRKVPEAAAAASRLRESVAVEIRENTDARAREVLRKLRDALEW